MIHVRVEVVKNIKNAAAETRKAMKTIVAKVDLRQASSAEVIQTAAKILQEGGLVAFPTETVYGLGGNGLDSAACEKIYLAKGRPSDNPLILHISEIEELDRIVAEVSPQAKALMDAFWPGPLTMIFKKKDIVPAKATGGLDTVAVRFPNHPVARAIIRAADLPIAAPSANSSGKPSPTRASHVEYDLDGKIDMIVDGGAAEWGLESTIVDVSDEIPMILRPGAVTKEMIEAVVGQVEIDPAILHKPTADFKPKAPGMKYRHYAPKAPVTVVRGDPDKTAAYIAAHLGEQTGVMCFDEYRDRFPGCVVECFGSENDLGTQAREVFDRLRAFDDTDVRQIWAQCPSDEGLGLAVANRIKKAAGFSVVEV